MSGNRQFFIFSSVIGLTSSALISTLSIGATTDRQIFRYIDVFRESRADGRGIEILSESWRGIHYLTKNLKFTERADHAYQVTTDAIQTFDFKSIIGSSIATKSNDGASVFLLKGESVNKSFTVDYIRGQLGSDNPRNPFDFAAEIKVREEKKPIPEVDKGYALGTKVRLNIGELSHRELLRSLRGIMVLLEPRNLSQLPTSSNDQTMSPLGRKMAGELALTLPETNSFLEKYNKLKFSPVIEKISAADIEMNRVKIDVRFKIDELADDYPALGDYLHAMLNSANIKVEGHYDLESDLRLFNFKLSSDKKTLALEFVTAAGAVIPTDADGQAHPEAALYVDTIRQHQGKFVLKAGGEALGLNFALNEIQFATHFHDGPVMHSGAKLTKIDPLKVSGRALGIFPLWAIDLSIPGSIDEYASMLTNGMLRGVAGKGTYVSQTVDTQDAKSTKFELETGTMIVDNFFLSFGMRMAQNFIWPSREVLSDIRLLTENLTGKLSNDLDRMAQIASVSNGVTVH